MVTASIIINQTGKPAGNPGVSREDLSLGLTVTLSNEDDFGVTSWNWEIISRPPGSSATLLTPTGSTSSFSPDVIGSYLISLVVSDGVSEASDRRIAAIQTSHLKIRIPALVETNDFSAVQGWADAMHNAFMKLDSYATASLRIDGENSPTQNIDFNNKKITGLQDPSSVQDAATKNYVDNNSAIHAIGGAKHTSSTLVEINTKVSDQDLIGTLTSASGDISGSFGSTLTVNKIKNIGISSSSPNDGYALIYRSSGPLFEWESSVHSVGGANHTSSTLVELSSKVSDQDLIGTSTSAAGDIDGYFGSNLSVIKIRGKGVSGTPPTDGQVLVYRSLGDLISWESSPMESHAIGGGSHSASTLEDLSTKVLYQDIVGTLMDAYGDVTGTFGGGFKVVGIQETNVSDIAPSNGQVLIYRSGSLSAVWENAVFDEHNVLISDDDSTPGFLIDKVAGGLNINVSKTGTTNEVLEISSIPVITLQKQSDDPVGSDPDGYLYSKEANAVTELFYLDSENNSTQITSDGYLATEGGVNYITLVEQGSDPVSLGSGIIFSKDVSGIKELFYVDSEGELIQITKDGYLSGVSNAVEEELESTGTETYIELTYSPILSEFCLSGRDIKVYRNGVLLRWSPIASVDPNRWIYNSIDNRVEFAASGVVDWYSVHYSKI